ncbi:MAG: hypothetical protein N3G20_08135, partial [Verrucomicrobiae bacterium]|nr:hypothetical protein [Verrucomicrobiae bacterium]
MQLKIFNPNLGVYSIVGAVFIACLRMEGASFCYGPCTYPTPGTGNYVAADGQRFPAYQVLNWARAGIAIPRFDLSLGKLTG